MNKELLEQKIQGVVAFLKQAEAQKQQIEKEIIMNQGALFAYQNLLKEFRMEEKPIEKPAETKQKRVKK